VPASLIVQYIGRLKNLLIVYTSIMEFVMNKNIDSVLQGLLQKNMIRTKEGTLNFVIQFLINSEIRKMPPYRTLLILDDFEGVDLLKDNKQPLSQYLTKRRHVWIECWIAVQTIKGIAPSIKRLTTSFLLWSGISNEDFDSILDQIPCGYSKKDLTFIYQACCLNKRDRLEIHIVSGQILLHKWNNNTGTLDVIPIMQSGKIWTYEDIASLANTNRYPVLNPPSFSDTYKQRDGKVYEKEVEKLNTELMDIISKGVKERMVNSNRLINIQK